MLGMISKWTAELPERTGRSLEQWIGYINREGPADDAGRRKWLKAVHGIGTNTAWWLTERAAGRRQEEESSEAYLHAARGWIEAMYAGKKAALRPIHDAVMTAVLELGAEVKICPAKTMISVFRRHAIASVRAAALDRVDLGLALGDPAAIRRSTRLIDTGGFAKKDRITVRVALRRVEDVDDRVRAWLRQAFDRDGR